MMNKLKKKNFVQLKSMRRHHKQDKTACTYCFPMQHAET